MGAAVSGLNAICARWITCGRGTSSFFDLQLIRHALIRFGVHQPLPVRTCSDAGGAHIGFLCQQYISYCVNKARRQLSVPDIQFIQLSTTYVVGTFACSSLHHSISFKWVKNRSKVAIFWTPAGMVAALVSLGLG